MISGSGIFKSASGMLKASACRRYAGRMPAVPAAGNGRGVSSYNVTK